MPFRHRLLAPLLLGLLLIACVGTDVGNPDGNRGTGGTIGGAGGAPGTGGGMGGVGGAGGEDGPVPGDVDLGRVCVGGVARASLEISNQLASPQLVTIEAEPPLLALPDEAEIPPHDWLGTALLWSDDEASPGVHHGIVEVLLGSEFYPVHWAVEVVEIDAPRGDILCGSEAPCSTLFFEGSEDTLSREVEVVNDGCSPMTITGLESSGGSQSGPRLADPAQAELPVVLQPGGRWAATLILDGATPPGPGGSLQLLTEEPGGGRWLSWFRNEL